MLLRLLLLLGLALIVGLTHLLGLGEKRIRLQLVLLLVR